MNKRQFLTSSVAATLGAAACSGPSDADGQEARSMVKLVFVMHRRPGMSHEDFSSHWRSQHAALASQIPGLRKYVQNHAAGASLDGSPPPFDGFTEFWFDDMASLFEGLDSPESQAALADSENFVDTTRVQTFVVEEVTVV